MGKEYSQTPGARYRRKRYRANPEAARESRKDWLKKHPEYEPNREHAAESSVYSNRKKLYGISKEEYFEMVEKQNGVCAICSGVTRKALAVDHDHITGRVRGLLCSRCNVGLGMFQENPELLEEAIGYLREHN